VHIVSIHAHPDDAEILAGGTLALLAHLSHQITIVTMTSGDCGSGELSPAKISQLRQAEASASARRIGAAYHFGGFKDLSIFNDDQSRRRMTGLLRELRPDLILTASPSDYLCDHEATSQLVRDACFASTIPNYATGSSAAPLLRIPHLYFMDPIGPTDRNGVPVLPDFVIDVSSVMPIKESMLAEHVSQRGWLQAQHGIDDYLEQMKRWTEAAGSRAGAKFGEGFRQYTIHPYPQTPILQEILARWSLKGNLPSRHASPFKLE
jgi:LmbE family N-acetylglucosaminyl deacetylase